MKKIVALPILLLLAACDEGSDCLKRAERDGFQQCKITNRVSLGGGADVGINLDCAGPRFYACSYRNGQFQTEFVN